MNSNTALEIPNVVRPYNKSLEGTVIMQAAIPEKECCKSRINLPIIIWISKLAEIESLAHQLRADCWHPLERAWSCDTFQNVYILFITCDLIKYRKISFLGYDKRQGALQFVCKSYWIGSLHVASSLLFRSPFSLLLYLGLTVLSSWMLGFKCRVWAVA